MCDPCSDAGNQFNLYMLNKGFEEDFNVYAKSDTILHSCTLFQNHYEIAECN